VIGAARIRTHRPRARPCAGLAPPIGAGNERQRGPVLTET
jgi:hypothetical protein